MQYTGRPHGGEGRGPSDEDGLWASNIFESGSQLASNVELIGELLQVRHGSACIEASDVLAVASLLAGIGDESSEEVRKSVEGGSTEVILGGEPDGCELSLAQAEVLQELNAVGVMQFRPADLPAVESLLAGISDGASLVGRPFGDPSADFPGVCEQFLPPA